MKSIVYPLLALAALLLGGCQSEYFQAKEQPVPAGETDVRFTIALPAPGSVGTTRAAYSDTDVETIDLLIYDESGQFLERIPIDSPFDLGFGRYEFTVRMPVTDQPRRIHVIANGRDPGTNAERVNFSEINWGEYESTALRQLKIRERGVPAFEEDILPLVMWGVVWIDSISATMPDPTVKLLRAAAAIRVYEDTDSPPAVSNNGLNRFEITGISLSNASLDAYVLPKDGTYATQTPTSVELFPGTAGRGDYFDAYGAGYFARDPEVDPIDGIEAFQIYTYDRDNNDGGHPLGPIRLIVEATWDNVIGYYPLFLYDTNEWELNENQTLLDIIRNHRYNVEIQAAYGPGYTTAAEAATVNTPYPANLLAKVEIVEDDERMHFVYADGRNYLAASDNLLEVWGTPKPGGVIELARIAASEDVRFELDPSIEAMAPWLSLIEDEGIYSLQYDMQNSTVSNLGSGDIHIVSGILQHNFHVKWGEEVGRSMGPWYPISEDENDWGDWGTRRLFTNNNIPWEIEVIDGYPNTTAIHFYPYIYDEDSESYDPEYPEGGFKGPLASGPYHGTPGNPLDNREVYLYHEPTVNNNRFGAVRVSYMGNIQLESGWIRTLMRGQILLH